MRATTAFASFGDYWDTGLLKLPFFLLLISLHLTPACLYILVLFPTSFQLF
jgi:hypothetical protein